jgi:hypothetical protein
MKFLRIPFGLLLPLMELVVWVVLVPIPTTLIYLGVHTPAQPEVVNTEIGTFSIAPQEVRHLAIESAGMRASHTITALNAPGVFVEILISLPTTWPSTWHPANLPMDIWRSITLPFFCLPAWWFAGRGFDSLRSRDSLRWPVALFGTLLCIAFVVLFCGLRFGVPAEDRTAGSWILWGMALWALLFGSFPLAWLLRRTAPLSK